MKVSDNLDSKGYGVATPLYSKLRFLVSAFCCNFYTLLPPCSQLYIFFNIYY